MARRLLIRTPNHLGDAVMALAMVNVAREAHPGTEVTLLVPESLAGVFAGNPAVDALLPIPTAYIHGWHGVFHLKDIISRGTYDLGYILPPSFGAAAAFKLAGVKERIGYVSDGRRLLLSKPLALPKPVNSVHRSELYVDLLRRNVNVDLPYSPPRLHLHDRDLAAATTLLGDFGLEAGQPYLAIAFQAVAESRRWGEDNYRQLLRKLVRHYPLAVVLIGSKEEAPVGERIRASIDVERRVFNLAGKTTLRQLAGILAQARLFVGNDSGPAHLAAAVETPVVVLSGADDPKETSPVTAKKRMLYHDELTCISCVKNRCPLSGENRMQCMRRITVDDVLSAVRSLVGEDDP